jgi:hypothetical protein
MKGIHVLILSAVLFFPSAIIAGSVQVAQWIPWSILENQISAEAKNMNFSGVQNNLSVNFQGLQPIAQSANWSISGNLDSLTLNRTGMSGSARNLSAELNLEGLAIDQVVVMSSGGNVIRIHIKASCTPIKIKVSHFSLIIDSAFASKLEPVVTSLDIAFHAEDTSLSPFTCSGLQGVDEQIASQIRGALSDPAGLKPYLISWLNQKIPSLWEKELISLDSALGENLELQEIIPQEHGVLFYAIMPLKRSQVVLLSAVDENSLSHSAPQLILSQEGFNALLSEKFSSLLPDGYDLQKVSAFASLMQSRVKQYVAWPDLRRFPTNSPFPISVNKDQYKLVTSFQNSSWSAQLNANGVLKASVQDSLIDYLNWGISLNSPFTVSVVDSVLTMKTGTPTFDLAYSFGALYQLLFNPNTRISVSIFKSSLSSFFTNKTLSTPLPVLRLGGKDWKLQDWNQNHDLITMDWKE